MFIDVAVIILTMVERTGPEDVQGIIVRAVCGLYFLCGTANLTWLTLQHSEVHHQADKLVALQPMPALGILGAFTSTLKDFLSVLLIVTLPVSPLARRFSTAQDILSTPSFMLWARTLLTSLSQDRFSLRWIPSVQAFLLCYARLTPRSASMFAASLTEFIQRLVLFAFRAALQLRNRHEPSLTLGCTMNHAPLPALLNGDTLLPF